MSGLIQRPSRYVQYLADVGQSSVRSSISDKFIVGEEIGLEQTVVCYGARVKEDEYDDLLRG